MNLGVLQEQQDGGSHNIESTSIMSEVITFHVYPHALSSTGCHTQKTMDAKECVPEN